MPGHRAANEGHGQSGQALPLVIGMLALVAALCLAIVRLGEAAGERARAETAADAAALAGAAEGIGAAARAADANDGALVSLRAAGADVVVEVRVGRVIARARARAVPATIPPYPPAPGVVSTRDGARPPAYTCALCRPTPLASLARARPM